MAEKIINTIVNHHFELYRELANTSEFVNNIEHCKSPNNTFPNFIFNENDSFEIEQIQTQIKKEILPSFWITESKTITTQLNKKGFKLIRAWPLLVMDKKELIPPKEVEGFSLTKVQTTEALIEWKYIVEAEYNYKFTIEHLSNWLKNSKIDLFIGQIENNVVSATLNFNYNNIVGSHLTATRSDFRKKGIGMQTVYSALNYAFKNGNETSIASTTDLGKNAWKKIGYNVLDDKLYINWFLNSSK